MNFALIGILLVVANILISYKGFTDNSFFRKYKFDVDKILINKEYIRFFSSGFLHVDWQHLLFNMITLYLFSESLELQIGGLNFLIIYLASLIGGNLLALFIHKNHGDYTAVGASGAVCGILFASIALFPGMSIGFLMLPIFIPGWLFALLYIGFTIYGIKSKRDNIGHEAHLGGALLGMFVAIMMYPHALVENYIPILIVFIPSFIFIYLIVTKPHLLFVDNHFFETRKKNYSIDHLYNEQKVNAQKELDGLLDKINKRGINSLTSKEKQRLEELSNKR